MGEIKLALFTFISFIVMIGVFTILKKQHLSTKSINLVFIISSVLTVVVHYLSPMRDLLTGQFSFHNLGNVYFLPIYPCNMIMWINVILIFLIKKRGLVFQTLAEFSLLVGTLCGIVGLVLNEGFLADPNFFHLDSIKGLMSHVLLIFTCLSLGVFQIVEIRMIKNLISSVIGMLVIVFCYLLSNGVLYLLDRDVIDSLFIFGNPYGISLLNFGTICLALVIWVVIVTTIYESIKYPIEQRWYRILIKKGEN